MRRATVVIGVLVLLVLAPMWYVGLQGEPASEEIAIDQSVSEIRPLAGPIDAPNKLAPSQVGVIVWIALFGLYGVLAGAHRFMNSAVRPADADATVAVSDGGDARDRRRPDAGDQRRTDGEDGDGDGTTASDDAGTSSPDRRADGAGGRGLPWFRTDERWLVEYHGAAGSNEGLVVMAALTVLAIAFSALFTGEYLTLARTQYFGLYAAGLFVSLAALTVAYYAWFMPHVKVAEQREH